MLIALYIAKQNKNENLRKKETKLTKGAHVFTRYQSSYNVQKLNYFNH